MFMIPNASTQDVREFKIIASIYCMHKFLNEKTKIYGTISALRGAEEVCQQPLSQHQRLSLTLFVSHYDNNIKHYLQ